MIYTSLLAEGLPLGFDIIEVLIYLLNFIILLVGMRLLLYKPIKKFMVKRESDYRTAEEANKEIKMDAQMKKAEAERLITEARKQAVQISEDATAGATVQTKEIILAAKEQAKEIMEKAKLDIKNEQTKAKEELLFSVSELAVDIASRILEREVKMEDNDTIINTLIEDWKQDA